jgi:hypothetical protein
VSNSATTTASQLAQSEPTAPRSRGVGLVGWTVVATITAALAVFIAAGLLRASWMPPPLPMPSVGPPWELSVHVPSHEVFWPLWVAGALATVGIVTGLIAARQGRRVPLRVLLVLAGLAIIALTVLPPIGTTDPLDYAVYGHIVMLGGDPYTMTPYQFFLRTHTQGIPADWQTTISVYGPLATGEQYIAARLGGASLARTVFWLKLGNVMAFAAIAFAADRMFRGDRAARLRAHLLWTANPLIIWSAIAGGHLDVLAAALGVAGLLILDLRGLQRPVTAAVAAGVCIGAAADIKADFALFGLAVAWSLWRRPRHLAAAAAGALAVLLPSYGLAGRSAIEALTNRASTGMGWGFYRLLFFYTHIPLRFAVPTAAVLLLPVAWLTLQRLPKGFDNRPAVRAALALSLTYLLVWPHQYAWYSIMAICVLVVFPASRLDWLAVAWLSALTIADMPGLGLGQNTLLGTRLAAIEGWLVTRADPIVMMLALAGLVIWCSNRRWRVAGEPRPARRPRRPLSLSPRWASAASRALTSQVASRLTTRSLVGRALASRALTGRLASRMARRAVASRMAGRALVGRLLSWRAIRPRPAWQGKHTAASRALASKSDPAALALPSKPSAGATAAAATAAGATAATAAAATAAAATAASPAQRADRG